MAVHTSYDANRVLAPLQEKSVEHLWDMAAALQSGGKGFIPGLVSLSWLLTIWRAGLL